jgi:hypothetical protein
VDKYAQNQLFFFCLIFFAWTDDKTAVVRAVIIIMTGGKCINTTKKLHKCMRFSNILRNNPGEPDNTCFPWICALVCY